MHLALLPARKHWTNTETISHRRALRHLVRPVVAEGVVGSPPARRGGAGRDTENTSTPTWLRRPPEGGGAGRDTENTSTSIQVKINP